MKDVFIHRIQYQKILMVWLVALIVRLVMLEIYHDQVSTGDEINYGNFFGIEAHNLLHGRGLSTNDEQQRQNFVKSVEANRLLDFSESGMQDPADGYYHDNYETPGYSIWIALVWKLMGSEKFFYVRLFQAVISSLMVFFIFDIGRKVFDQKTGIWSALIFALFLPEARFSVMSLRDVWVTWTGIMGVWATLRIPSSSNTPVSKWIGWGVLTGIFFTAQTYFRSSAALMAPWILFFGLRMWGWKRWMQINVVVGGIMLLLLLPWVYRNYQIFGKWQLRGWFHYAMLSGFMEEDPSMVRYDPLKDYVADYSKPLPPSSRMSNSVKDEELKALAVSMYRNHFLWCIKADIKRFFRCFFSAYFWGIDDQVYMKKVLGKTLDIKFKTYLTHPFLIIKFGFEKLFYPLTLFVGWFLRKNPLVCFLMACMFYFPIMHSMVIYQARFILPGIWPVCILFTAGTYHVFWRKNVKLE